MSDSQVVDVSWDPITRIVGSLGIHTKIDFGKNVVAEATADRIFTGSA